jgi:hypothetical protein
MEGNADRIRGFMGSTPSPGTIIILFPKSLRKDLSEEELRAD